MNFTIIYLRMMHFRINNPEVPPFTINKSNVCMLGLVKARLHRRFLSRQLDAIFVALKLQQVSNMFETPAIS